MAALSLMATAGLLATSGFAQTTATTTTTTTTTTTPAPEASVQTMEKFEVTGSYLPPAANSVAIPVITVDSAAIENSGNTTSVLEILRKTTPQFSGNSNVGAQNANVGSGSTQGGAQLALRNASTLVLINGRRSGMANSATAASGNSQFVDVNQIPVAAIEAHREVLADGASAIYGSDAIAGVVNIILKSDYEGFEAGARYGWSTDQGHYAELFRLRRRRRQRWQEQHHALRRVVQAGPDLQLRASLFGHDFRHGHVPGLDQHRLDLLLSDPGHQCAPGYARWFARRDPDGQWYLPGPEHVVPAVPAVQLVPVTSRSSSATTAAA